MSNTLTWLGIAACVLQSGTFSGLNLAMFGVGRMELEAKAAAGNEQAKRLRAMRADSNFLLTTILWGNVGTNVLLTLLTDSVLAGAAGFVFSTFVITFGGEIIPQAYFSRHALRMATLLRPVLVVWKILLFPIAKPTALLLDAWLGEEELTYHREPELREAIKRYIASPSSEVSRVEGIGALNFLSLDDVAVGDEGEPVDPASVVPIPNDNGTDGLEAAKDEDFVQRVQASGRKWVILTSGDDEPRWALDSDEFLRAVLSSGPRTPVEPYAHAPVIVRDPRTPMEQVLPLLKVDRERAGDNVIDRDLILVWGDGQRRVITGADVLGRLLQGIVAPRTT